MDTRTPAERHRAMSWAQRLKRVFQLDPSSCEGCGGQVRVIACVEDWRANDPAIIRTSRTNYCLPGLRRCIARNKLNDGDG